MLLRVEEKNGSWVVVNPNTGAVVQDGFTSNEDAWAWIDRNEALPIAVNAKRQFHQRPTAQFSQHAPEAPMRTVSKPKRILRPRECWTRMGIKRDTFYANYVYTKRLRLIPLGKRARGVLESDLDRLIDEQAVAG